MEQQTDEMIAHIQDTDVYIYFFLYVSLLCCFEVVPIFGCLKKIEQLSQLSALCLHLLQ